MATEEERIRERLRRADEARDWVESMLGIRRNTSKGLVGGTMNGNDKIRQLLKRNEELEEEERRIKEMIKQLKKEKEETSVWRLSRKEDIEKMMQLARA
jgi:hypothetical protein